MSRYRSIYRMIPDKHRIEALSQVGVRRTHLYRLAKRDVPTEVQQSILQRVLDEDLAPRQIESEADESTDLPPAPGEGEAVNPADMGEILDEGSTGEDNTAADSASAAPEVKKFKDRVKRVCSSAESMAKKLDSTGPSLNDDFDGLDRAGQKSVEPDLSEAIEKLRAAKKSIDVTVNRIKGCI